MHFYILKATRKEIKKTFPFKTSSKIQNSGKLINYVQRVYNEDYGTQLKLKMI